MFEEYLLDSHVFFLKALEAKNKKDADQSRRYFRVSIVCAFNAMEAFVNYTAGSFHEAGNLDRVEVCFLMDQELYFSPTQGIKTRTKYNPLEEKIKALIRRFVSHYDFGHSIPWNNLLKFKDLRDSLVHSRNFEDDTNLDQYETQIKSGFTAIVEVMNLISEGIYKKPLRRSILDLIPE